MRLFKRPIALFLLGSVLLAAGGCQSVATQWQKLRFHEQKEAADAALSQSEYALAATRYEALLDRYPESEQREQLRYRQGIAFYLEGAYQKAVQTFDMYLLEYPNGEYAEGARDYLNKVATVRDQANSVRTSVLEDARQDLEKLMQLREQHPHDADLLMAIGNLQYELEQYDAAAQSYYQAMQIDAALQERTLIQERLMIDAQGEPVPVTPEQVEQQRKERNPVVVFDTNEYLARSQGGIDGDGDLRYYIATGMVRNQSSRLLSNVQVEVNFFDMHSNLMDTQRVGIGPMMPGEVRAFRVRSSTYDNLYNIERVNFNPIWRG